MNNSPCAPEISPRSRTPVDDAGRQGRRDAQCVDVGHDIVSPALLLHRRRVELGIANRRVRAQLRDGLVGNVEPELLLRLGQVEPELAPGGEAVARRENVLDLVRAVSRIERTVARSQ